MLGRKKRYFTYQDRKEAQQRGRFIFILLVVFFGLYQGITLILLSPLKIQNPSMEPTYSTGSSLMYSPVVYGVTLPMTDIRFQPFTQPHRGDVVVVANPQYHSRGRVFSVFSRLVQFITFNQIDPRRWGRQSWEEPLLVKRIIAVPGDTLKMDQYLVSVKPAGESFYLTEYEQSRANYAINQTSRASLWTEDVPFTGHLTEITLEEDEYYFLGDNRPASMDSRYWGPLHRKAIKGKVLFPYWPLFRSP